MSLLGFAAMRRVFTTLALALLVGFLSYRVALATMPPEQYRAVSVPDCAGIVSPAHFDWVTGLPIPSSCTNSDGQGFAMLYASAGMYEHFARSWWFGLGVVPLAFVALWWLGRRRGLGLARQSEALASA